MRKLITILVLLFASLPAMAQHLVQSGSISWITNDDAARLILAVDRNGQWYRGGILIQPVSYMTALQIAHDYDVEHGTDIENDIKSEQKRILMRQLGDTHVIALISRTDALAIYKGAEIERDAFTVFTATTQASDVRGKEFVTFERSLFATIDTANEDRAALIRHLKQFVPEVKNICIEGVHRGMDCSVHFRHLRF